jgi:hypothetical protein
MIRSTDSSWVGLGGMGDRRRLSLPLLAKRAMLAALTVALSIQSMPLFAQGFEAFKGRGGGGETQFLDFASWPVRAAIVFLIFLVAIFFFFQVVFRAMLNLRHPWWPLTAYGFNMAMVLTCTFGFALWLFWFDMEVGGPPRPWLNVWGGRLIVLVAYVFLTAIVLSVCRSSRARQSAEPT